MRHEATRRAGPPLRYAAGITCVQFGWLVRLALPHDWGVPVFLLLVAGELLVPIIAERAPGGPTTWHPHHIAERYGLSTIIMLGEAVAAATIALRTGLDLGEHVPALVLLAVAGLVIVLAYLATAALTLLAPLSPAPVHVMAGLLAVLVGLTVTLGRRASAP